MALSSTTLTLKTPNIISSTENSIILPTQRPYDERYESQDPSKKIPLSEGYFPVVTANFPHGETEVRYIDMRALKIHFIPNGGPLPQNGVVSYPTYKRDGQLNPYERARLGIVTSRYLQAHYITKTDLKEGLYIDTHTEKGLQFPLLIRRNGQNVGSLRLILPKFNHKDHVPGLHTGSELEWNELPIHEHIPWPYREIAKQGVFFRYNEDPKRGSVGYATEPIPQKLVVWAEVSQLARERVQRFNIWDDITSLIVSLGRYIRNSRTYKEMDNSIRPALAICASPVVAQKLLYDRKTQWLMRNIAGMNIVQVGPTEVARGSDETPLLLYPIGRSLLPF